jgi:hypothetical protein
MSTDAVIVPMVCRDKASPTVMTEYVSYITLKGNDGVDAGFQVTTYSEECASFFKPGGRYLITITEDPMEKH